MSKTKKNRGWVVILVASIAMFVTSYTQYQFPSFGQTLMDGLGLSETQYSSVFSAALIPGAVFSLISGLLVDRYGVKKVGFICILISAAANILHIFVVGYVPLMLCMILVGVTGTYLNSNSAKIIGSWYDAKKTSLMMGIFLAVNNGAMAIGVGSSAVFPTYRAAFTSSAVVAVTALVLWGLFMKDNTPEEKSGIEKMGGGIMKEALKASLKSPGIWTIGISIMMVCGGAVGAISFLPTVIASRGFTESQASLYAMCFTIGGMLGCLTAPALEAKLHKRRLFLSVFGILAAFGIMFAWKTPGGVPLVLALAATGYFALGLTPILMSMPVQVPEIGTKYAGTAGGLVATIQLFGIVVLTSYVITPISAGNYDLMFLLLGLLAVIFVFIAIFGPLPKGFDK